MQARQRRRRLVAEDTELQIQPIKRVNLSQSIIDSIAELLIHRVWKPGHPIPSEKELALQFGVGRSTIREVLQSLVVLGVIEIRPGEGSFVREPSSELLSSAFRWSLLLSDTNVDDLVETRLLVEVECAGRAARAPNIADVEKLEEIHRDLIARQNSHKDFTECDNLFHLQIATMAQNVLFRKISRTIQVIGRTWYPVTYELNDTKALTVDEHYKILDGIRRADSATACRAMRDHLIASGARLKASLEQHAMR